MKPMRSLLVVFLVACGGLQTTETACEEGFTKADDGACYPTAPEDGGGGIDNEGDGEDGPDAKRRGLHHIPVVRRDGPRDGGDQSAAVRADDAHDELGQGASCR